MTTITDRGSALTRLLDELERESDALHEGQGGARDRACSVVDFGGPEHASAIEAERQLGVVRSSVEDRRAELLLALAYHRAGPLLAQVGRLAGEARGLLEEAGTATERMGPRVGLASTIDALAMVENVLAAALPAAERLLNRTVGS